jgi:hypothetical protein
VNDLSNSGPAVRRYSEGSQPPPENLAFAMSKKTAGHQVEQRYVFLS